MAKMWKCLCGQPHPHPGSETMVVALVAQPDTPPKKVVVVMGEESNLG